MPALLDKENRPPDGPGAASTKCGLAGTQYDYQDNSPESDLVQEFAGMAAQAYEAAPFDWLLKRVCIPRTVLHRAGPSIIGVCRAELDGRYWRPCGRGTPVLIAPDSYSIALFELDPFDLIAWTPANPDRWYWRNGSGRALGEQEIERAATWRLDKPLLLHATPLDWICSGGVGACILDWRRPTGELRDVKTFHCPNRRYAKRLKKLLAEPPRQHTILYPGVCHAA